MDQPQRQIDRPNADAGSARVCVEAIRALGTGTRVPSGVLLISSLIGILGIVDIPRAAGAAT